jgi:1,4-dihydroxy-2-naphthoate octaprenyltransferase
MQQLRKIIFLSQPVQIFLSLMSYSLGLGLARYLGASLSAEPQFFGGLIIVFMMAVSNFLKEYFRPFNEPIILDETRFEREALRKTLFWVSISFLVLVVILLFMLARDGYIRFEVACILFLFISLSLAMAIPPVRLVSRGWGELATAIQISSLSPSLAFLFIYGRFHRILTIYTFPLLLLSLAYFLALNFPSYSNDMKFERRSLLISMTWQRAVPFHNGLIAMAYLFFAATPFLGIPFGLIWPGLLTLPLAGYQILGLRNISEGSKPNWIIFVVLATTIFGLTTYLLALTLWLR